MIYLDNAATSFPKPREVIDDLNFCLKKYCGNSGRSSHALSVKTSEKIYESREEIADFLGFCAPEQVVFTYNATYALNIAIKSFVSEKCHILTSDFEHNSVIRPLEKLKNQLGVEYSAINTEGDVLSNLRENLRPDTKGLIASIASNVTGDSLPLQVMSDFAKENGLFLIVDGSQAVGHQNIDLTKTPCDAFCAPGHKALFGIQGSGFICFKDKYPKDSLIEGGSGTDSKSPIMPQILPEGYEAGTLAAPAIISLGSGVRFIKKIRLCEIEARLDMLTDGIKERLCSVDGVKMYKSGIGLLSFNLLDIPSSCLAMELDKYGICTRGGLHCAPSIHKKIGTLEQGAVRISFSYFNNMGEVDRLYRAVKEIRKDL